MKIAAGNLARAVRHALLGCAAAGCAAAGSVAPATAQPPQAAVPKDDRPEEAEPAARDPLWSRRHSVGASLPFTSSTNVVGAANQTSIGMDFFFDTHVTYREQQNSLDGVFEVEGGFLKLNPEGATAPPVQKTRDRIRADLFYTRLLRPNAGPYVRFGLLTNAAPSNVLFTEATDVSVLRPGGARSFLSIPANGGFRTGGAFAPLLWREGFGVNARLLGSRTLTLDWRGGFGLRQNRYRGALFLDDDPATAALEYREAASFNQEGVEMTVVAAAHVRFLILNTHLDLFGDVGDFNPTIDWRSTIGWRLTGGLSIDYKADLLRLPQVRPESQLTQTVLLRYSFGSPPDDPAPEP